MKKSFFLILMVIVLTLGCCFCYATENIAEDSDEEYSAVVEEELEAIEASTTSQNEAEQTKEEEVVKEEAVQEEVDTSKVKGASKEILESMSRKDRRIKELTQKYNDSTLGTVAYWLEVVRFYSTPVLFVFLVMGAFNFFIVGNKKLDKKEQGFGWITTCLVGWVVFQCIPLIFALVTIGLTK